MGRNPCSSQHSELNRGAWTAQEDYILAQYIKSHGVGRWRSLPQKSGLKRCGKSCRLRWLNYLRPDIKRGNISAEEEELIVRLHGLLGNRWKLIAGRLPGRTDNEIKNYWNTHISKRTPQGKETFSSPKCEAKFAHPASNQESKSVPVKTKAVKISNGYCGSGVANYPDINSADNPDITNITESWWNSLVEEYIKEDDSKSLEFSIIESAFPSSYYSVQDFYLNDLDQAASSMKSNVDQEKNFMEEMGIKVNSQESYGISDSKHLEKL